MRYDQLSPGTLFIDQRREMPGIKLGAAAVMFGGSPSHPYPYKLRVEPFAPVANGTWAVQWGTEWLAALEQRERDERAEALWQEIVSVREGA